MSMGTMSLYGVVHGLWAEIIDMLTGLRQEI